MADLNPKEIIGHSDPKPFPPGITGQGTPLYGADGKPLLAPDGKPITPGRTTVQYRDGTTEVFEFDYNHPPNFTTDFGTSKGMGPIDHEQEGRFAAEQKAAAASAAAENKPVVVRNPDGSQSTLHKDPESGEWIATPVTGSESKAPKIEIRVDSNGAIMLINTETGTGDYVRYNDGSVITDPNLIAEHGAKLGLTTEQINDLRARRVLDERHQNLAENQQAFTQQQTSFQNAQAIEQARAKEGQQAFQTYQDLAINLPRTLAADERAAQAARAAQAVQALSSAVNRETLANQAGQSAVSDAQWMAQHTATPGFLAQLGQLSMHPGLLPNPGAPGQFAPLPDLSFIRSQGQDVQRAQVPDFATALNQAQGYPVARPDLSQTWDYLSQMWPSMNIWAPPPPRPRNLAQTDTPYGFALPFPGMPG